ncbi:MAG: ABC transporter ATP-binding protein [Crocinitomicaceae bacterium TMED114]|nr:MAG: ABC transporter ATP-binding protein [Crocinitomicaceae bacterium TMED114]
MRRFGDLFKLVLRYRLNLAGNIAFNALGSVLSLFTFLAIVPFLRILFRTGNAAPDQGAENGGQADAVFARLSQSLDALVAVHGAERALLFMCGAIAILAFVKNLVTYLSFYSLSTIRTGVARDLRNQMFDRILALPVGYFTEQRKGDLISRMTNDLMEVEFSVIGTLEVLFKAPIMILLSLITLFAISWELTLFALVFMPVAGVVISRIATTLRGAAGRGKERLGALISRLEETLGAMMVVKAFDAAPRFRDRFSEHNEGYFRLMRRLYKREYLSSPVSEFVSMSVIAVLLGVGGRLVLRGEGLEGELFIGYLVVFSQIIPPARSLSDALFKVQKGAASLDRLDEVLQAEVTVEEPKEPVTFGFETSIRFDQVRFGYPGSTAAALDGFSLDITKGETVALVGASGSGKTTVARLLLRLYDPDSGSVRVDGTDIRELRMGELRRHIGFVTQDPLLFNDTVEANIALFDPTPDAGRIAEVSEVAHAREFIDQLPEGDQTPIGDGGGRLSGGQRQRLAIARALYHDPPILVLDEATSALDAEGERLVQAAIERVMEGRTALVIAHRLSTVRRADRIVVMSQGRIVEVGTHAELMALEGTYHGMVALQQLEG